jgi:hypothetical protein
MNYQITCLNDPKDNHHTRRHENLKSQSAFLFSSENALTQFEKSWHRTFFSELLVLLQETPLALVTHVGELKPSERRTYRSVSETLGNHCRLRANQTLSDLELKSFYVNLYIIYIYFTPGSEIERKEKLLTFSVL